MSELDEEVVTLLNNVSNRVATVLGEGVVITLDVVETTLVNEGTGASATVRRIDNLNILSEEEVKILSPSCDVLAVLIGLYGRVTREVDGRLCLLLGRFGLIGNYKTATAAYVANGITVSVSPAVANRIFGRSGLGVAGSLIIGIRLSIDVVVGCFTYVAGVGSFLGPSPWMKKDGSSGTVRWAQ